MNSGLSIALLIVAGVLALLVMFNLFFRAVRKNLLREIQQRLAGREIVKQTTGANLFGVKSLGAKQLRGNGALVLTATELYFLRALPKTEYRILLTDITGITLPKSFNGKTVFRPLLCVHFRDTAGEDAMAWAVRDPESWRQGIEALLAV